MRKLLAIIFSTKQKQTLNRNLSLESVGVLKEELEKINQNFAILEAEIEELRTEISYKADK